MVQTTARTLPCPPVGHKTFEKSLKVIRLEDADTPAQISKFIRPSRCLTDDLGSAYLEGELQRLDMTEALARFKPSFHDFIKRKFHEHRDLFQVSQCRIYQFQSVTQRTNVPFIFGLFITDSQHNLIDFCLETKQQDKRRPVLLRLIREVCTPTSVIKKLSH